MAIQGIEQPAVIQIDESLRLRKYDGVYDFALAWYQDEEIVYLVDGKKDPYTMPRLKGMYEYLNDAGELYFIEVLENGTYKPIGDVTFWQEDMPIVIGERNYRGRKIGRRVVSALVQRGSALGYDHLEVGEIYDWNEGSRRCFESVGFQAYEKTEKGAKYKEVWIDLFFYPEFGGGYHYALSIDDGEKSWWTWLTPELTYNYDLFDAASRPAEEIEVIEHLLLEHHDEIVSLFDTVKYVWGIEFLTVE